MTANRRGASGARVAVVTIMTTNTYSAEEIVAMERTIGHAIPRPYSQTLAEDFGVMPELAKRRGEGIALMSMVRQVHVPAEGRSSRGRGYYHGHAMPSARLAAS